MTIAPQPVTFEIGDIVGLTGKPTRYIIRELQPDGKHAVCERAPSAGCDAFFGAPGITYSSYVLALKDLERR